MKKFIETLLVVAGICLLFGCTGSATPGSESEATSSTTPGSNSGTTEPVSPKVKVTSILITSESNVVEIEEGSTLQLTATVAPENASNKQIEWLSSNTDCAIVDAGGLVSAIKAADSVAITAKAKDGSNVTGTFTLKIKAAVLPANSILNGLMITDNYNHTITPTDYLTLPNNRKGYTTKSVLTIKNNGEKSLTFVSSSITNINAFHTDGNCSLVNNGTNTTFLYRDLENIEFGPGAELNLTLASYTSTLGVNIGKISFVVNDGAETTETLDINLKILTTDTYRPLLKLTPETEGTVYVDKTNKGTFNFTLENTAAYLPLNVSAEVNLYKTIPYYTGSSYPIDQICQKIQKITEVQYPTESLEFLHPADTYNFNLSTSNTEEGGFIFEVIFTYDYEDYSGSLTESYKQTPIYYTFYTEPEKEPELVQETFYYTPLGVYGGKAYFYSNVDTSSAICILNEDNTFTELDASHGNNWLRAGDELYFNQRILYNDTEQWLYKLGSNGLEKLTSSTTGIDFSKAVKCGDVIYYADDRVLHGSGSLKLHKIDLNTNQISQVQTNDKGDSSVYNIICADSNYLYYDFSYEIYALKLSDESYQKVSDSEGVRPFVYKDKAYIKLRDKGKYYIINGTKTPELVENELTALLLEKYDYTEFEYYTVGDSIVFYNPYWCVIYDGTTVKSYECNYVFRDGDSIYWIKQNNSYDNNGYTGELSYFDGSTVKELNNNLLYMKNNSDQEFVIHQASGNKKMYYIGYNGSLISFDFTTQKTRAVYFTNSKNVTGSGDPFNDKCKPYISYGDGLSYNGNFYFTSERSLYSYRE
ncbi:MAG: Ig-like domain-containing protein [Treponema sp.]|nr:Ig-like domain-containing protein [Treponema sp.]